METNSSQSHDLWTGVKAVARNLLSTLNNTSIEGLPKGERTALKAKIKEVIAQTLADAKLELSPSEKANLQSKLKYVIYKKVDKELRGVDVDFFKLQEIMSSLPSLVKSTSAYSKLAENSVHDDFSHIEKVLSGLEENLNSIRERGQRGAEIPAAMLTAFDAHMPEAITFLDNLPSKAVVVNGRNITLDDLKGMVHERFHIELKNEYVYLENVMGILERDALEAKKSSFNNFDSTFEKVYKAISENPNQSIEVNGKVVNLDTLNKMKAVRLRMEYACRQQECADLRSALNYIPPNDFGSLYKRNSDLKNALLGLRDLSQKTNMPVNENLDNEISQAEHNIHELNNIIENKMVQFLNIRQQVLDGGGDVQAIRANYDKQLNECKEIYSRLPKGYILGFNANFLKVSSHTLIQAPFLAQVEDLKDKFRIANDNKDQNATRELANQLISLIRSHPDYHELIFYNNDLFPNSKSDLSLGDTFKDLKYLIIAVTGNYSPNHTQRLVENFNALSKAFFFSNDKTKILPMIKEFREQLKNPSSFEFEAFHPSMLKKLELFEQFASAHTEKPNVAIVESKMNQLIHVSENIRNLGLSNEEIGDMVVFIETNKGMLQNMIRENRMDFIYMRHEETGLARTFQIDKEGNIIIHLKTGDGAIPAVGRGGEKAVKLSIDYGDMTLLATQVNINKVKPDEQKILKDVANLPGTLEVRGIYRYETDKPGQLGKEQFAIVTPLYNVGSLAALADPKKLAALQLTEEEKKDIILQMLMALKSVSTKNYVHNDVRLENFLMDITPGDPRRIRVVLADLNTMKPKGVVASHETYSFSAVEHLHGNISTASDVWSLGLNLKRWLDGLDVKDLPLDNGDLSQLRKPLFPTEPRTALDHLVWEMTKTNPEDRVSIDDAIARVKSMNDIHDPVEEDKGKGRARPRTEVRSNILKGLGQ